MRCKNCGTCEKEWRKRICWTKWQLCGECGVIEHPDFYHNRITGIVNGKGFCKIKR